MDHANIGDGPILKKVLISCQSLHFAKIEHIYQEQKPCSLRHRTM